MSSSKRPSKGPNRVRARSAPRTSRAAPQPTAGRTSSKRPAARPQTSATRSRQTARQPAATPQQVARKERAPAATPPPRTSPAPPPRPAIRLPGSASSPLTIKAGAPAAPKASLELSTKPRPKGPRLLSDVQLEEDEVLIDPFDATLGGIKVRITAVLERTCVYIDRDGDRRLARKNDLWVEADKLPIRRRGLV